MLMYTYEPGPLAIYLNPPLHTTNILTLMSLLSEAKVWRTSGLITILPIRFVASSGAKAKYLAMVKMKSLNVERIQFPFVNNTNPNLDVYFHASMVSASVFLASVSSSLVLLHVTRQPTAVVDNSW
jgi:hypothetical protein